MNVRRGMNPLVATLLFASATFAPAAAQVAQERVDLRVVERIRDEGFNRSQVEDLALHLTDVIGPRLTGSPAMKRANEWTAQKFREWGLTNVVVEPWGEFGRGWERVSYSGRITEPFVQPLHAQPLAWTGSTQGTQAGPVIAIRATTPDELRQQYRGRLRGAWVLPSEAVTHQPEFTTPPRRIEADALLTPPPPPPPAAQRQAPQQAQERPAGPTLAMVLDSMMRAEGALGTLRTSPWAYGMLRGGGGGSRNANDPEGLPVLMVSLEQYGQLWRNAVRGVPVHVEINVQNRFFTDDLQEYNTLADLRGTDRADEYVMIGGHLDSWHMGTGATDNASGSVVMMEAMRILKAIGVQPRRTIRVALWSGEEQGLLGSRFWVQNNRALHPQISAYLNVDNGTGRLRGIWNQGNVAATPVFEQILWPFRDIGVVAVRHGNTGSTDHMAFDAVGIPGFNFIQDPMEYFNRTHHSSADTFERLVIDDLKQAAVVVASTAYHLAMRDEMVPRKPAPAAAGR
jgi:carboxypeptidase Q